MQEILSRDPALRDSFREIIAQPQSDIPGFRRFLTSISYEIEEEDMVLEDGKYYPMMRAVRKKVGTHQKNVSPGSCSKCGGISQELSEEYGGLLLQKKNQVLREWLIRRESFCQGLEKQLETAATGRASQRLEEIRKERSMLHAALALYR